MAELIKVNKKVINDPLYTPVIKFLKDRIANLEITGPADELALSKQRYDGLVAGDLVIESAITFPDGAVRVCIVSRKTGFARVDIDIKYVQMDDILTDFAVPLVEIEDIDHLKTYVKALVEPVQPTLLYLKYKDTYGVLVTQEQAKTHEGPMEAFGNLFFENYVTERESENSIDWETLECGTVTITDPSFGRGVYPLFIYELVLSEAQLPEITSNLPTSITSRRGEDFTIPNTFWFAGTQDITTVATVELSTKTGYAILERSSDLLEIDGETIYGSATKQVEDQIIVRVTYDWNGRLVHKNFYIQLIIEKDLLNDLVITSVPSDVEVGSGNVVETTLTATFKGDVVEILIPPTVLRSSDNRTRLAYVKTNKDLSMVYRGTANGQFAGDVTKVNALCKGDFNYNDNGTINTATGYINISIVKPDVLPEFTVTGVPTLIEGYKNDAGAYKPVIKYGDKVISVTDVGLLTGIQGTKQLLDITAVSKDTGVNWEIVRDSDVPGQSVADTFTQTYSWVSETGAYYSKDFVISIKSNLDSIIEVVPAGEQPRRVKRYQTGGPTFNVMVNGVARNSVIQSLKVDDPKNPGPDDVQYIINAKNQLNRWMVIQAEDHEITYSVDFTFTIYVDQKFKTMHYTQEFIIEKYPQPAQDNNKPPVDDDDPDNPGGGPAPGETGTGPGGPEGPVDENGNYDPTLPGGEENPNSPGEGSGPYNTNITAVPTSFTIAGVSDKAYKLSFKIFKGENDITADTKILDSFTIVPEFITIKSLAYNATTNSFVLNYYKDKGGKSQGGIFIVEKTSVDPIDKKDIARLWLNVDIEQTAILKLIDPPKSLALNVDQSKALPVSIEFSGKALLLNDPNLTIVDNTAATGGVALTTDITDISDSAITFLNNTWVVVGGNYGETMPILFTYVDPVSGNTYTQSLSLAITITYPPMEVVYTASQEIDAKIWDTGTFPLKLMAGEKDWTANISGVQLITGTKYIEIKNLDWSVIFAEKTATSQIVGLRIYYTVGKTSSTIPADFKFNLAAWDGITFIADSHTPDAINANSGDKGEITATFIYKGNVATDKVAFAPAKSTVPETVILGTAAYDADRKLLVIPYELTKGGTGNLNLVFTAPNNASLTTNVSIDTTVAWPDDLNILTQGANIRGFYQDTVKYPLTVNVAGVPVDLTDPNMDITFTSGDGDPLELEEILKDGLNVLLAAGGVVGTSYDYTVNIALKYTNQETGKVYTKTLTVPATIRVPAVKVGSNPTINANVFDHGPIQVTLVDERGTKVPITSYGQSGGGANVMLYADNVWYVTSGPIGGSIPGPGTLPLRLGYSMGGQDYTIDVTEEFTINPWDGKYYHVTTTTTGLEGDAGETGTIPFVFDYIGWPDPGTTLDLTRSIIPKNINIGELDANGNVSYTLAGQADLDLTLCFVRANPSTPQVEGMDYAMVTLPVSTKSSNLPFTLVSNDDAITLDWSKSGVIKLKLMYGDNDVPANTPGLKYTLADADYHGITITGATKDGVTVKATRSGVAGSTIVYPENITVSYEVGAPEPKTVSFDASATISMGPASIDKNATVNVVIWRVGSFGQLVSFNGTDLTSIDHFEIRNGADNKYVEVTQPKGYEIIGAEPTTTTQSIPMTVYYKVDSTDVLQKLDFDASFQITGSTSVRFKVTPNPTKVEGSLDKDVTVTVTPVYKDKNVGGSATFKPDLSTIPAQLTLKDYKVVGTNYVLTFTGAKAGLGKMTLVFWSPDAGTSPKPRDVASCDLDVQVMGELGIEIGNRDNLLTGKNADTGNYNLQILFGGIPIDAAAAIADGTLTATREVGAATTSNANVLTLNSWTAEAFNYTLVGCVQPNATVNVSDFINLSYTYGGTKYTARVEIPLKYTSSTPTFDGWPASVLQVFAKGGLAPTAVCDGVNIASGIASISNYGDTDDKYVTLGGSAKTYEVIWGEKTQITHNVSTRIVGQYRIWPWSVVLDIPFTIAAWNQKTWFPKINPTSWDVYLDLTGTASSTLVLTGTYKNQTANLMGNPLYDASRSDLKDIISITGGSVSNANTQQNYTMKALKVGSQTAKICWKWREGATPGVEDVDFGYTDLALNIKQNSLYGDPVASSLAKGGSGDTVTGSLVVRLTSSNAQILNTNTNLVIATVDEKVFKITGKAASTFTVLVTADYTVADGPVNVPMTFTYTDPTTGYVTKGTFDYPFTLQRPADWPVVTQSTPANTVGRLWTYGPNPFKVMVGSTDVTTQVVPTSCVDDTAGLGDPTTSNYMQLSLDQPVAGTWWWITNKNYSSSQQTRTTKWKLTVPYRGSTVSVDGSFIYIRAGDGTSPTPEFQGSTTATKTLMQNVGDQTEIPFALLWRNYKYSKGVFKPDLSGTDGAKFSDYFKVVSQRYDDSTGTTYLKIEMTQVYEGSMAFVWDTVDNLQNPVVGTNRVSVSTSFYDLTVTDLNNNAWAMWNRRALNTLVSIKDGDTELATTSQVISISNAILVTNSSGNNTYVRAASDVATDVFTGNIVYTIQLPAAYNNRQIKVTLPSTIAAYDGNEFTVEVYNYSTAKASAGVNFANKQVYVTVKYRGSSVTATGMGSDTTLLKSYNPDATGVYFGTIGTLSPSNWIYYSFGSTTQYYGDLKIPIRFTGTAEKVYPKDTEGKNLNYLTIPVQIFEPKLYIYPGDSTPDAITAAKTGVLAAPVMFSMGKDISTNQVAPNTSSMSWVITGNTMSGLVSKPTSNPSTATGINLQIDYDNRGEDVTVDVPVRMTYNGQYSGATNGSGNYTITSYVDYVQKVLIKGSNTGNTIVATNRTFTNMKVWNVSGPGFDITLNGTAVPASRIKDIQIASNPYIRRPETSPDFNSRWFEIYNGKTDGPTDTVATFTVTFTDGIRDYTVTQDVPINIQKYSGTPWNVVPIATGAQATVDQKYVKTGPVAVVGNQGYFYLQIYYKNATLTEAMAATYGMSTTDIPGQLPGFASVGAQAYYYIQSGNVNPGPSMMITVRAGADDTLVKKQGRIKFGFKDKVDDPTSVQGQDWIYVDIETLTYLNNNKYYIVEQGVTEFTSRYTNPVTNIQLPFKIRSANNLIPNMQSVTAPALSNNGNLTRILNDPNAAATVAVGYSAELTSQKQITLDTIVWLGAGLNSANSAQAIVKATQISNYDFPTISNVNSVNATLNQSGGLPFTIKDDSGNDITSTATMTAIATNDYIKLDSGKWVCYNTRTADTSIQVTFTYTITYKGNLLTMKQDVPFVIKPYTDQPSVSNVKVVSGKVWEFGSALPFTINISGNPVPASWITGVSGTAANSRVQVTSLAEPWYIVAGSTDGPVSDTVSYTVTVTNGTTTWTVKQDVVFNIAKYDGIELIGKVINGGGANANTQSVFYPYNATGTVGISVQLYSKGRLVTNPQAKTAAVGVEKTLTYVSYANNSGSVTYNVKGAGTAARNTTTSLNVSTIIGGTAGTTEGINVVTMSIPVFMVAGTGQLLVHPRTTTAMSGKYGTPVSLAAFIIKYVTDTGSTFVDLTTGSTTVTFAPNDVISLVADSFTPQGYKVNFVNKLYADTVKDVTVTLTNGGVSTTYVLNVTQLASPADQPDVKDNNGQTAGINQTGALPFKLVDPDTQQDVTSTATISSIDSNDYIELVDGKWRVKKDVTADTHSNVTFNLLLNYRNKDIGMAIVVDFLIKPFDGKFVIVAVPDITANVWDRGTVIPLTISVNGNAMPASWITGYAANPVDQYVAVAADGSWQVVAGNKDAAMTETVGYAANVAFPGGTTAQAIAPVKYNIGKYDGVEFKLQFNNLNTDGVLLCQAGLTARGSVSGYYRGDIIGGTSGFAYKAMITNVNLHPTSPVGGVNFSGIAKLYDFTTVDTPAVQAQNVLTFTRPGGKTDDTAVEGIDYAKLVVPITSWKAGTVVAGQTPSVFEGKLGDVLDVRANLYYGGTRVPLDSPAGGPIVTITPNPALGIEIVSDSIINNGFKLKFTADVSADTPIDSVITYRYQNGSTTGTSTPAFKVIQHPSVIHPDVNATGTMQPVEYGETGQIVLTGTYGDQALAGNVTFVPESSDAKGLVEFGTPTTGDNGTVVIPVTGIKVGKDNLTIHIKVNGASGNTSGKDYLDIIVAAEVTYASLSESEDFQTSGTGYQGTPVTLTQSVILPTDE